MMQMNSTVPNQQSARSISVAGLRRLIAQLASLPWFVQRDLTEETVTSNHIRAYILQVQLLPLCAGKDYGHISSL